jgi:hypothetical protein
MLTSEYGSAGSTEPSPVHEQQPQTQNKQQKSNSNGPNSLDNKIVGPSNPNGQQPKQPKWRQQQQQQMPMPHGPAANFDRHGQQIPRRLASAAAGNGCHSSNEDDDDDEEDSSSGEEENSFLSQSSFVQVQAQLEHNLN